MVLVRNRRRSGVRSGNGWRNIRELLRRGCGPAVRGGDIHCALRPADQFPTSGEGNGHTLRLTGGRTAGEVKARYKQAAEAIREQRGRVWRGHLPDDLMGPAGGVRQSPSLSKEARSSPNPTEWSITSEAFGRSSSAS